MGGSRILKVQTIFITLIKERYEYGRNSAMDFTGIGYYGKKPIPVLD